MSKDFTLEGKAYWARFNNPDDNGYYTVDLAGLSKDILNNLAKEGITVSNKDTYNAEKNAEDGKTRPTDVGDYVRLKTKFKPEVYDINKTLITSDVGNGSVIKVRANIYDWKFQKKSGKALGIAANTVLVKELVTYKKGIDTLLEGETVGGNNDALDELWKD